MYTDRAPEPTPACARCAGIEHLSLAANAVRQLPEGLRVCRALRTLSLARNPALTLAVQDVGVLVRACPRLERVQVTECNGGWLSETAGAGARAAAGGWSGILITV